MATTSSHRPGSESGPQIKGTCVSSVMAFLRDERTLDKVLQGVSEPHRSVFTSVIVPASWYPVESYLHLLDSVMRVYAGEGLEVCHRIGRRIIHDGLNTVYRVILKVANPQAVLKRGNMLWGFYFKNSDFSVLESRPGRVLIKVTDGGRTTRAYCKSIMGGMAETVELSGGKDPQILHPRCRVDGADSCVFEVHYS